MFKLDKVTITGADDSVKPEELVKLSQEFPFVEWGILLSEKQEGSKRFPSRNWKHALADLVDDHGLNEPVQLSGHLCGKWCRALAVGNITFPDMPILSYMKRLQLNFHAETLIVDTAPFMRTLKYISNDCKREIVFQIDGVNDRQYHVAKSYGIPAVGLFDQSHGAGALPSLTGWPAPIDDRMPGYSGGLGPDNLAEQIQLIRAAAGEREIWIDMETKVRSDFDRQFDLGKVRQVLEIAKPWVEGEPCEGCNSAPADCPGPAKCGYVGGDQN